MDYEKINTIIGVREDVENVLLDVNDYLLQNASPTFCIGQGPDGPTATWSRELASGNFPLMVYMQGVAAILRRKLDIAAHVVS